YQAPIPPTIIPSAVLENLPTFDSVFRFEDRVKSLEVNFSEFMQTNQFAKAISNIPESVNAPLEAEVLTRSSHSSRTSYAVAADLTEMELKKILIEKIEGNKSIQQSDEQRNLSTTGTQSRQMLASESAFAEENVQTTCQMDEPPHPVFKIGAEDQLIVQTSQHPEWFSQPRKPPTPDQEVYKATTDQLDWVNPEGQQYPHNLLQPLPLIPDNRGRRVIPFAHFINNDLEYIRGGASSLKYTTSVTKTKAADYGHIKWIEDLVPRTVWIQEPLNYDKHTLWGVSHWGRKCQQFYGFAVNRESALDIFNWESKAIRRGST
nr:hypothetical protein [Tanacetum cinerariifolium]